MTSMFRAVFAKDEPEAMTREQFVAIMMKHRLVGYRSDRGSSSLLFDQGADVDRSKAYTCLVEAWKSYEAAVIDAMEGEVDQVLQVVLDERIAKLQMVVLAAIGRLQCCLVSRALTQQLEDEDSVEAAWVSYRILVKTLAATLPELAGRMSAVDAQLREDVDASRAEEGSEERDGMVLREDSLESLDTDEAEDGALAPVADAASGGGPHAALAGVESPVSQWSTVSDVPSPPGHTKTSTLSLSDSDSDKAGAVE